MIFQFRKFRDIVAQIDVQLPGSSFWFQRNAFTLMGMWPAIGRWDDQSHYWNRNSRFYRYYSMVLLCCFLHANIVFQVIKLLFFTTNLGDFAEMACLFATQCVGAFKVQRFNANYRQIRKLLDTLNDSDFRPMNEVERGFVRTAIKQTFNIHLGLFSLCSLTLVQRSVLSVSSGTLNFAAWYPLNMNKTYNFVIAFVYQIISVWVNMISNTSLDLFIVGLIMHITAQVERLGYRLSLIKTHEDMIECIEFHQKILSLIPRVENLFGASMFFQICISVVVFCMTGFVLVTDGYDDIFIMLRNLTYLFAMFYQISTYCWAGNELIYTSDSLTVQAFHTNFAELDLKTKKLLLLFMRKTISNLKIRAKLGFAFDLSLPTLILVLKSSYSYFAVLHQMSDK